MIFESQNQNPLYQSPEMQCTNVACEKERKEAEISMVNIFLMCRGFCHMTAYDFCIHRIKIPSTRVPKCSVRMWPVKKNGRRLKSRWLIFF